MEPTIEPTTEPTTPPPTSTSSTGRRSITIPLPRRLGLGAVAALALGALFVTTAGSCDERGLGDAPVGERLEGPRTIIVMPDKFANIAVVCDGTTRLYVTTREAPPVAVPDHPACRGGEG